MDLKTLHKYKEEGWLMNQVHPDLPLTIWNYTQQTQFEGMWDEITLSCRGLVTDDEGNIVARPFKKFFNVEERKHTPTKHFSVYEKMDGSLGIAFNYKGQWIFASRGSFTSDQCLRGIEILNDRMNEMAVQPLNVDYTYMFEIIYPENRIVVDYGDMEDVVMLGAIRTSDGMEMYHELLMMAHGYGWSIVKKYDGIEDFTKLKEIIHDNQEGFVVHFTNGDRMKVKGEEYVRLHKIMTEVSTKSVWEMLSNDMPIEDILVDVPDEFFDKIKEEVHRQTEKFDSIFDTFYKIFNEYKEEVGGLPSRAVYSEWVRTFNKDDQGCFWLLYDGRDITKPIWRALKPEFKKL